MQRCIYLWLLALGLGHVGLGVALALAAKLDLAAWYFSYLQTRFGLEPTPDPLLATIVQLFGPTVASWGALFTALVYLYREQGHALIKPAIYVSLLLWLPLDSLISAYYQLYIHVYLNLTVALLIVLPVWILQPERAPVGRQ